MKRLILSLIVAAGLVSCKKEINKVPDNYGIETEEGPTGDYVSDVSFKNIGYCYANTDPATVDSVKFSMLTHVHFAFLYPKTDGSLTALTNVSRFVGLKNLAKERGAKVAISLGGDAAIYRTLAADATIRKVFVENVVQFVRTYKLDGVDLDWEYPSAAEGSDVTNTYLVKELATKLHALHKYLSIAVTAGLYAGPIKEGITEEVIDQVDFVNLMAYDARGLDPASLNHHSTYTIALKVLDAWQNDKGLPKEKSVLGIPLYGKDVNNNAINFGTLLSNGANPDEDSYTLANVIYYYNGLNTLKQKVGLAKERANGLMYWEINQDASGNDSLIKAASLFIE
ncbi:glycosyl hydrolase family 18 protein [Sphingobacterium siyangense]|uniref:chitinase n=1 Tax=Sphingobacterium siyangense TaxID=459529 RepID=A0A562MC64_9SPHI|nr:glycosyl hydrolase family 18 protein [Sphingobacterium siyangense]TWI17526.1 glycosyl hydrolase family 18 (putative chitinase) [Sphingobacterium siyangense]